MIEKRRLKNVAIFILTVLSFVLSRKMRGDHASFMAKELIKAIIEKSKTTNKYLKWPSRENYVFYKTSKNKCNSLTKKQIKSFLRKLQKMGLCLIKSFGAPSNLFN